jgi:hypothetical protein
MTDKIEPSESERRRFFRIDDEVGLEYDLISEEEYKTAPEELEQIKQTAFSLSAEFATLNNEYNPTLNSIRNSQPEVAQYLDLLNRKIDSISSKFLEEEIEGLEENTRLVNLSASGIAFKCNDNLPDAQPLKLRIILLPEKIGVVIFGRVQDKLRSAEQRKEGVICVDFEHIRYEDQELMIKHNLNKQMLILRQRNEEKENKKD